jgi:hypothetical protein
MFINDFENGSPTVMSEHTCSKSEADLRDEVVDTRRMACDGRLKKWDEWVAPHLGDLVLNNSSVCRLIGFADDSEDYYYVLIEPHKNFFKDKDNFIQLHSCVGGFYPIKGSITDEEYAELEARFKKFDENSGLESFLEHVVGKKFKKTMFRSKHDRDDYEQETYIFLKREDIIKENERLTNLPIDIILFP